MLWLAPLLVLFTLAAGAACGWLKTRRGARTGDTRKLFHALIFVAAAVLSVTLGVGAVNLLGGVLALYVIGVVSRGDGNLFFEGIARETDAPRRSLYVIVPFVATALGGIATTALFGAYSAVGFAVTGFGDALAEPIGTRWGRHRFRVPSLGGCCTYRSLEGSAAVLVGSFAACALVLWVHPAHLIESAASIIVAAFFVALVSCLVEAVSHHGIDNFTLQLAASGVAWTLR